MINKEFNLLREPWVLVMKPNGKTDELSLLDLFRKAPQYRCLAGEIPTQNAAILRLLLAVLHAVFGQFNVDGEFAPISEDAVPSVSPKDALNRWKGLWDKGSFPMEIIEKYLTHFEERFYLFHPNYPFYQVPGLNMGTQYNASKLNGELSESNNKIRLFSNRSGLGKNELSYSEAARWLIYMNAFDDSGAKTRVKGLPSLGIGWLGKLGIIQAVGKNLFETLMLNLVLLKQGGHDLWGREKPIWESKDVRQSERTEISMPDNLSELYTLQSRRILLEKNQNIVTGYRLVGGDFFNEKNALNEPQTLWENIAKTKDASPVYQPKKHDSTRLIWRGFSTVVSRFEGMRRPGIVDWIEQIQTNKLVHNEVVHFCTSGIEYTQKKSSVEDVFYDEISFNTRLLTALGADWVNRILIEIEDTVQLAEEIGRLAEKIALASGSHDGSKSKSNAKEQAYFLLDLPFRKWLLEINPSDDDMDLKCNEWWKKEQSIIRILGKEMMESSGTRGIVGREIEEKKRNGEKVKRRYSTPGAYNWFLYRTSSRKQLNGGGENA